MRPFTALRRPGVLLAVLVPLALLPMTLADGVLAVLLAWSGALLGLLGVSLALQLGMLLGASLGGGRVTRVGVGVGRLVREWSTPRRVVAVRAVPVSLSVSISPDRLPVRLRLWATGLCSALAGATAAALPLLGVPDPLWTGALLGGVARIVHALLPRDTAGSTSTGWLLFRLPRVSGARLAEMEAAPLAREVTEAVLAGQLTEAAAAADRLARARPGTWSTSACQVSVLEATGRYAKAVAVTMGMVQRGGDDPRRMSFALAGLAGLAVSAVEVGQVEPDTGLPVARRAMSDAVRLGYPEHRLNGTRAALALLDGDVAASARLAALAADQSQGPLSRADDLATLARARMAAGDNAGAREALGRAEELAAWWPRVAAVRERLDVGAVR
ncbi:MULTISPECIES: hypothetical protein [Actinoalloteichus]|uniref:hypothetical protein n=1 Tax=Actinoalloteichus TaxID=65496 RepID=UPI00036D3B57|nr:hypothetical protein [Actinoalloteichus spitiensis]